MINTELKQITPAVAADMLSGNRNNRKLSEHHVIRLAKAMARGEWVMNGDVIRISTEGELLDGQHRLHAVIRSGVTITSLVVSGLDRGSFDTMDIGKARTAADALSARGITHYSTVASGAKLILKLKNTGNPYNGSPEHNPTIVQIEQFVSDNPELQDMATRIVRTSWVKKYLTNSMATMCLFVFSEHDVTCADEFFGLLESGAGLEIGSPILLLRDRLTADRAAKSTLGMHYKAALVFKAFRLFKDGALLKNLRVRTDGDAPEKNLFIL